MRLSLLFIGLCLLLHIVLLRQISMKSEHTMPQMISAFVRDQVPIENLSEEEVQTQNDVIHSSTGLFLLIDLMRFASHSVKPPPSFKEQYKVDRRFFRIQGVNVEVISFKQLILPDVLKELLERGIQSDQKKRRCVLSQQPQRFQCSTPRLLVRKNLLIAISDYASPDTSPQKEKFFYQTHSEQKLTEVSNLIAHLKF